MMVPLLGIALTGGDGGTSLMGDGTNLVQASNALDDYSYMYLNGTEPNSEISVLFRCSTGLGPSGSDSNNVIGNMSFNNVPLREKRCNGLLRPQGAPNVDKFPGVYHGQYCSQLTTSAEGVYTCTLRNSSMMDQSISVGIYFSGRSKLRI